MEVFADSMLLRSMPTWLLSGSLNSEFRPTSNSTARRGEGEEEGRSAKRPRYWPERALGGEVELERAKTRPKPGLVLSWGKMEKTNEVEKEEIVAVELEVVGGVFIIWIWVLWKTRPVEYWLEPLVSWRTGGSSRVSPTRVREELAVVALKELKMKSREEVEGRIISWRRRSGRVRRAPPRWRRSWLDSMRGRSDLRTMEGNSVVELLANWPNTLASKICIQSVCFEEVKFAV